jgi:hypothetical protein
MYKRFLALLILATVAASIGIFVTFPKLSVGPSNSATEIAVEAKQPQLICPGPVYVNGGATGLKLGKFTQSGVANLKGRDGLIPIAISSTGIKTLDGSSAASKDFNVIQSQVTALNLAAGLAVANCLPGLNEAWFVAGDNSVGREALLILVNPSSVDATVSLQILGPSGQIMGAGLSGISAPAEKVTVLPLAAFAPKASTFAVRVSSRGAALGMWLQQKTIRGLTPGGLDYVGPTGSASKTLEIPGFFIRSSSKLAALSAKDQDFRDTRPLLRVFAQSDSETTFTAQVQGANGASFGTVIQGTVSAGSVADFDLGDLADGDYVVHIEANHEIMASAIFNRVGSAQPDLAWATAVTPTLLDAGFTAVSGAISKLSVANASEKSGEITLNGRIINLPARSNIVIVLVAGTSYQISSNVPVAASQVIDVSSAVAVVPVLDYRSVAGRLKILVR